MSEHATDSPNAAAKRGALRAQESEILVRVQSALAGLPGVLPAARGLSYFGEHSLGWLGLAGLGAVVDSPRRRQWFATGVAAFGAHATSVAIKRIVRRPRPDDPRITIGVGTPSQLSFPSSHAASTTAALVAIYLLTGRRFPLAGIPVMMVSRMVLGVHFPLDTACGAALGAATAAGVMGAEKTTRLRLSRRRRRA